MDTQNIIKPATLEEAFEIPNSTTIIGKETSTMELRNVAKKPIKDMFLDNSDSIEDAEIFYPSKMNEVIEVDSESIDTISFATGLSMPATSATLLTLEFDGVVKSFPGKIYSLSNSYALR